jgi:hypothetical protein
MIRRFFAALSLCILISVIALAEGGKLEAIGAFSGEGASDSLKGAIEAQGHRVLLADGSVVCEIWMRKAIPARAKSEVAGAVYTAIQDSAVVAVISYPKGGLDFRGQAIKPGAYVLRYALHPADGNHMGISPVRDFLLLVPVSSDQNADAQFKFEELTKMSTKASGTNHPAPLSLISAEGKAALPALFENDHGHLGFAAKVKTTAGEMAIAFIVKGVAEQ